MTEAATIPSPAPATATVSTAVLDNLAARFRPSGLCLVMLRPDGSVAYQDSAANLFFQRYALPMIQYPEAGCGFIEKVSALNASSAVEVWDTLPGVLLAVFPFVEKRQLIGVLVLVGKSSAF